MKNQYLARFGQFTSRAARATMDFAGGMLVASIILVVFALVAADAYSDLLKKEVSSVVTGEIQPPIPGDMVTTTIKDERYRMVAVVTPRPSYSVGSLWWKTEVKPPIEKPLVFQAYPGSGGWKLVKG